MKTIYEFGLSYLGSIINYSELADFSIQIGALLQKQSSPGSETISRRLTELAISNYSLREMYIRCYANLAHGLYLLDNGEVSASSCANFKITLERDAFCFITSAKSSLDLLAALLYIIENRNIPREDQLPDLSSYKRYISKSNAANSQLENLRNNYFILQLTDIRNKIIHRGYSVKIDKDYGTNTNSYSFFLTKTERAFGEWESDTDMTFAIDLMEKININFEGIMETLTVELCKVEHEIANIFVREDIPMLDLPNCKKWLKLPYRLIEN